MERKRLLQEGLAKRAFPPQVAYPEHKRHWDELSPLAGMFDNPVVVWVPESLSHGQKPQCIVSGCSCTPRVKEYLQRVVEDVEGKQDLFYIKYQCGGSSRTCFSTISSEYLQSNVEAMVHFSFILGSKTGYSKNLLEMVHDGMMSPNGLSNTLANIRRRRQARYYKLYTLFADRKMSVRKVLRVDHSAKFCKKIKVWEGPGQRSSISDAKLLLLVQNEVGQIAGRRLTRSENNVETAALLEAVKPILKTDGDEAIYLVSDNANAVRGMVQSTFGDAVHVKQDPFHVMMRIKEKIASKAMKNMFPKGLMSAMYSVERKLRPPKEMEERFRRVTDSISARELSCSEATWLGCVESNATQIKNGDLFVDDYDYAEAHTTTRVVSTSQLEGFHSGLKKLLNRAVSAEVALRILDIFIVQYNLKIGGKFGRNASFGDFDFVSLAHATTLSKGTLHESPQLAFIAHILSGPVPKPYYRSNSPMDFGVSEWLRMFDSARVEPDNIDAALARPRRHWASIRELLLLYATNMKTKRISHSQFMTLLHLAPRDPEQSVGFSLEEYELLRQVRIEQTREECGWSTCPLVTTIMFNIAVDASTNSSFKLRHRSYTTIVAKLNIITDDRNSTRANSTTANSRDKADSSNVKTSPDSASAAKSDIHPLFSFDRNRPEIADANLNEQAFQIQLFRMFRDSKLFTSKKKLFVRVYNFDSWICDGIWPKSEKDLFLKWGALKRADNRGSSMKIKLSVSPDTLAKLKQHQEKVTCSTNNSQSTASAEPFVDRRDREASTTTNTISESVQHVELPSSDPVLDVVNPSSLSHNDVLVSAGDQLVANSATTHLEFSQPIFAVDRLHTVIAKEDVEFFRTLASSTGRVPGRWEYLYRQFLERYPSSKLGANVLCCRLKEQPRRAASTAETQAQQPPSN